MSLRLLRPPALVLVAAFCLFPFYWMAISALRPPSEVFSSSLLPTHLSLDNFHAIFGRQGSNAFLLALRNSAIIATAVTTTALVVAISAAYALARLKMRRKRQILILLLAFSMFPGIALLVPLFVAFTDIGWIDTYAAVVVPCISFTLPFAVWMLTNFFTELPWELEDAARMDGATRRQALTRVMLPIAMPAVVTTAIVVFIATWNEYMLSSAMTISEGVQPVTVAIAKFSGVSYYEQPFGPLMAAGVVVTLPLIALVLIAQRRIASGLTAGSLTG